MTNRPPRGGSAPGPANIADPFWDLLLPLDERRRRGFIRRLAVGYYDNWRPTRAEVALLVDIELGLASVDDALPMPTTALPSDGASGRAVVDTPDLDSGPYPDDRQRLRAAIDPPAAIRATRRTAPIATFDVDCGLLASPFRFVAYGLSSAGWTVRKGGRYRRAFLHYRLVSSIRPVAARSRSIRPMLFAGDITCVPDIAAPYAADDGRSRNHSPRATAVLGSRGPWPIADGVTRIDFLITAQPQPGSLQRQQPAGSLRVDLRSGTASWRTANGRDDVGTDRAAAR